MLLAIDPGNTQSGYTLINNDYSVQSKGKIDNEELLDLIKNRLPSTIDIVIEMVASYGMAVGQTVFDTSRRPL